MECVDVLVGGGVGHGAALGEVVAERVPIDEQVRPRARASACARAHTHTHTHTRLQT